MSLPASSNTPAPDHLPSLVHILTRRVMLVTFVAVGLLTTALLFLLHHSIHEQTDALLIRLAEEEALSALHHPDEEHLHDATIAAPTLQATVVHKHALILDQTCRAVEQTSNVWVENIPQELCPAGHVAGDRTVEFTHDISEVPLRVAAVYQENTEGETWAFVVGIPHKDVDASTWRSTAVAIPLALLAALLIVLAVWLATKPAVRELDSLRRALDLLERRDPQGSLTAASDAIQQTPRTSAEVAILGRTLQQALHEMHRASAQRARFIAEASHELRTPLTVLRGELELALRKERSADDYKEALTIALESTLQLQELTEHLLEISRTEERGAQIEHTNLRTIIEQSLHAYADRFRTAGIDVRCTWPSAQPMAALDPVLTERSLTNLLDNVLLHAEADTLTLSLHPDNDMWVLYLADNGTGIPLETREILFEPFGRSAEGQGHGLGLFLVRSMMLAQNGCVHFVPTQNASQGTCMELHFPAISSGLGV